MLSGEAVWFWQAHSTESKSPRTCTVNSTENTTNNKRNVRGLNPVRGKWFFSSLKSKPSLGHTRWVPAYFTGVKQLASDVDCWPSSADVNNEWSCTSAPTIFLHGVTETTLRSPENSNDTAHHPHLWRRGVSAAIRKRYNYAVYVYCTLWYWPHLLAGLPSGVFLSGFPIKILYKIRFPWQKNEFLVHLVGPGRTVVTCNLLPHTGFYTCCAFKWLHVFRPRCWLKYHDNLLRCVCPCHLAVGMFCGHQRKQ